MDIIQQTYSIEKEHHCRFKTFENAKDYFCNKLDYARTEENIMTFCYPEALRSKAIAVKWPENFFELSYDDIMSLMNTNPLSDSMVDFIVDCFNFYIHQIEPLDSTPSSVFGKAYDIPHIVPSTKNYVYMDEYFESSNDKIIFEKKKIARSLKHWYSNDEKDVLSDILDHYDNKNLMISNYLSIFQLTNNDYALCLVKLDPEHKSHQNAYAQTLYFHGGHDTELHKIRVWIAKYYGLYLKESNGKPFQETDFDGNDIRVALDYSSVFDNSEESSSIISQKEMQFSFSANDNYNSGVYCLGYYLTRIKESTAQTVMGRTQKDLSQFAKGFRLSTLSMIAKLYEHFNETVYSKYSNHLRMHVGKYNNLKDVRKWRMIHHLFDHGVYKVNIRTNFHANHVMEEIQTKELNQEYRKLLQTTNKNKRKLPDTLTKNQRDIKRQQIDKANIDKLKGLELFVLRDEYHARNRNCFDISNKECVMFSSPNITITKPIPPSSLRTPLNMAKDIANFISLRYSIDNEPEEHKQQRFNAIISSMSKFDTYVMLEPGTNEDNYEYVIAGALVVEPKIMFSHDEYCTIIHLVATAFEYEKTYHMKALLEHVFVQPKFDKEKTCVFVYKFGKHEYKLFVPDSNIEDEEPGNNQQNNQIENKSKVSDVETTVDIDNDAVSNKESDTENKSDKSEQDKSNEEENNKDKKDDDNNKDDQDDKDNTTTIDTDVDKDSIHNEEKQNETEDVIDKDSKLISEVYTHVDLFKEMGFVKQDCQEVLDDILPGSLTMIGDNSSILAWCKKNSKIIHGRTSENKYKICKISGDYKLKFRYHNGEFQVYSHAFEWTKANDADYKSLTYQRKKFAQNHEDEEFVYRGGFGARTTIEDKDLAQFDFEIPIDDNYKQMSYSTENNCVWLSTAIIVSKMNKMDGDHMIQMFRKDKQKFEWMRIKSKKKDKYDEMSSIICPPESLQEKLQRDVGYVLKSIPKPNNGCYKNKLLNDCHEGKYIVMLKLTDGQYSHVVGVDCDEKKIYDCMEDYGLELTSDNFDFCGGTLNEKVHSIPICFQLMDNNKKRPWNT